MDIVGIALEALEPLEDDGIIVKQGWYDGNIRKLHVTVWNLGEYAGEHSDDDVEVEIMAVQVCIWSDKDQIKLKKRIKCLMKRAGFHFMGAEDNLETDTRIFMNAARFMAAEELTEQEDEE
uniref:Uncharacterized protein n=1 Tax=Myoviridae sp. ctBvM24 TaxID=2825050 RepID=A0A8S5UD07_9CAUD|nr:MAG TPA: Protein of unknown function (DUF806) [Myoviridae sp. ctBvM24]